MAEIDRTIPLGQRDPAMFLLLATYGLCASNVAGLELDAIPWRSGQMCSSRLKSHQPLVPPVTDEVGAPWWTTGSSDALAASIAGSSSDPFSRAAPEIIRGAGSIPTLTVVAGRPPEHDKGTDPELRPELYVWNSQQSVVWFQRSDDTLSPWVNCTTELDEKGCPVRWPWFQSQQ